MIRITDKMKQITREVLTFMQIKNEPVRLKDIVLLGVTTNQVLSALEYLLLDRKIYISKYERENKRKWYMHGQPTVEEKEKKEVRVKTRYTRPEKKNPIFALWDKCVHEGITKKNERN